jgi:hypothetical protein
MGKTGNSGLKFVFLIVQGSFYGTFVPLRMVLIPQRNIDIESRREKEIWSDDGN